MLKNLVIRMWLMAFQLAVLLAVGWQYAPYVMRKVYIVAWRLQVILR